MKEIISTDQAPSAIGPYSQAVRTGGLVFLSGQIPLMPNGEMVEGGIEEQAKQVMKNLGAVLEASGSSYGKVLKSTIYLKDLGNFGVVNEIYGAYFESDPPARATVQVAALPKGALVEIDMVAEV